MGRLKIKGKLQRSRQLRIIMGMQQRKEPEITKFFCGVVQNQENTAECRGGTIMMCVSSQSCPALGTPGTVDHQAPLSWCPCLYLGKNTGVGSHFLFQRLFQIQGLNPHCLHCRWILYRLSHQGYLPFSLSNFSKGWPLVEFSPAVYLLSHKRGLLHLETVALSGYKVKETCFPSMFHRKVKNNDRFS